MTWHNTSQKEIPQQLKIIGMRRISSWRFHEPPVYYVITFWTKLSSYVFQKAIFYIEWKRNEIFITAGMEKGNWLIQWYEKCLWQIDTAHEKGNCNEILPYHPEWKKKLLKICLSIMFLEKYWAGKNCVVTICFFSCLVWAWFVFGHKTFNVGLMLLRLLKWPIPEEK